MPWTERRLSLRERRLLPGGFNPRSPGARRNTRRRRSRGLATACVAALAITLIGFFAPATPLWLAGLPMIAAIVIGTLWARAIAMAAFLLWPVAASASALITLGYSALHVWPLAAMTLAALATAAAGIGLAPLAITLTLIAVFPASPVLLIADAVPGSGLVGPILLLLGFAMAEALPRLWLRVAAVLMLIGAVLAWGQIYDLPEPPETAWQGVPEPRLITERARWIALRDSLAPGSQAIFGENLFGADNPGAAAFWCAAVRRGKLTLWIGVMDKAGRGQVWRFDSESCAGPRSASPADDAVIVHAARYGIPGITGTWRAMNPIADTGAISNPDAASAPDWLICFEAFLPRAWLPLLTAQMSGRPVVILSNDRAFGSLPLATLRHKVSRAMGRLTGRTVLHAETGKTFLLKGFE